MCNFFFEEGREYLTFIEDQAFSPLYNLAPPSPPPSPVSKLSLFFCVSLVELTDWKRGGGEVGEELNYTTARKPSLL
jgi:hypothetical protein